MAKTRICALMGPTAGGKAALAVAVARAAGAHLLSCDSMKVYRGLDVGTAKPGPAARDGVRWWGIDVADPWESWNASRFVALYAEARAAARAEGRPLLLSGGTMLYLKAATEGLGPAPPRDAALRDALRAEAAARGLPALHAELAQVDPETAARVHPNDLRRIVRGLEVHRLTGRPQSSFHGQFGTVASELERRVFVIARQREDMDRRIDGRVERMFEQGWVDECRALLADPRGVSSEARQALGYRELFDWLEAGCPEPEDTVRARIQTRTRRFARRQLTWLRHLEDAELLEVAPGADPLEHLPRILAAL